MRLTTRGEREARPGGRWSTPRLVDDLLYLAVVERTVAHLIAAWVPKVPELDDKLALASWFESSMARASALRHQAFALHERDANQMTADSRWIEPLRDLDVSGTPNDVVHALLGDVRTFLLDGYRDLGNKLDPLFDTRILTTTRAAIDVLASPTSPIGTPLPAHKGDGSLAAKLSAARAAEQGTRIALDAMLWRPVDRVPVPARPAGRNRPTAGTRAHVRTTSRLSFEDICGELNDNVMAELCAMELVCRSSYEHPDQPWSTHLALARHATDEARHAAIFRRLQGEHGVDESLLTQHGANYEYAYEFPECEAGSERELLWRLLILCTVLEALAIDKLPVEIGGRDFVGQSDFARALDYTAADELFHVEYGLRLVRILCDRLNLDPILERERVHGRFFGRQRAIRSEYVTAHPDQAATEMSILQGPDPDGVPYVSRTEVELRMRASFTIDECEQVERWKYNPIRHQLLEHQPKNILYPAVNDSN